MSYRFKDYRCNALFFILLYFLFIFLANKLVECSTFERKIRRYKEMDERVVERNSLIQSTGLLNKN